MYKIKLSVMALATLLGLTSSPAQNAATPAPAEAQKKILIIVENRADAALNDKISVLEDLVSSRVAGKGFSVISRDVTINAIKSYDTAGIAVTTQSALNANGQSASVHNSAGAAVVQADSAQTAAISAAAKSGDQNNSGGLDLARKDSAQAAVSQAQADIASGHGSASLNLGRADSAQVAATPETAKLDRALSDNTSALRLAQNLGVDYILVPAITSYGTEKKSYTGNGIQTLNTLHRLRVSYKIVEAGAGGAVRGGTFVSESTTRDTGSVQTDSTDTLNSLLDDAADQLAAAITASGQSLPVEVAKAGMVNFRVACTMTDPRQQPIVVSAASVSADNKLMVTNQPAIVQPMDVTVELDGVALGSAPGDFKAQPGLHKLRLSREGFDDWERTINVYDGQTLRVALQMSDAGYARWAAATAFLSKLDNTRKLTDAEAAQMDGLAKFLSESHYRVDTKENVHLNKSLY